MYNLEVKSDLKSSCLNTTPKTKEFQNWRLQRNQTQPTANETHSSQEDSFKSKTPITHLGQTQKVRSLNWELFHIEYNLFVYIITDQRSPALELIYI